MDKILLQGAAEVVRVGGSEAKKGKAMGSIDVVEHGSVLMENGRVTLEDSAQALLANEAVRKAYLGL